MRPDAPFALFAPMTERLITLLRLDPVGGIDARQSDRRRRAASAAPIEMRVGGRSARLLDLSREGCSAEIAGADGAPERLIVTLLEDGEPRFRCAARRVWAEGDRIGLALDRPVDVDKALGPRLADRMRATARAIDIGAADMAMRLRDRALAVLHGARPRPVIAPEAPRLEPMRALPAPTSPRAAAGLPAAAACAAPGPRDLRRRIAR